MFVPAVIVETVARRYELVDVAELDAITERYYAIAAERRIVYPGVLAIRSAARTKLFA